MADIPTTFAEFSAWLDKALSEGRLSAEAEAQAYIVTLDLKNLERSTGAQQSAAYRAKALEEIRKLEALIGG